MKTLLQLEKLILAGLFLIQLFGCMPPLYFPNGINAPLLSKQGQFTMNASTDGICTDIQLAASPGKKVGVLLNINFSDFETNSTSSYSYSGSLGSGSSNYTTTEGHSHSFFEGGIGTYKKLGTHGRFENFGLIGFGSATSFNDYNEIKGSYARFAIQSDIGIETKAFEGIFSCRAGYLDLNVNHPGEPSSSYINPSSLFIDPAITLRLGWRGFKLCTQYGLSIPFNGETSDWNPGWLTIGLQMKIQ